MYSPPFLFLFSYLYWEKIYQRSAFCLRGTKIHDYPDIFQKGSEEDLYIDPLLIMSFKTLCSKPLRLRTECDLYKGSRKAVLNEK